ncbi:MAG: ABC transporter ATP-binding protein [Candidatus Dadabacteria bacterium]|nr:MAG: ABC transporter ATP-binding protein [Candidatus Dadabacteria bacterium]
MDNQLFSVEDLYKSYGVRKVLRGLSFKLFPGEIVLLLGANGAGKSTLLRICARLLRADSGKCSIASNKEQSVSFVGHSSFLYRTLTVRENLELAADLIGVNGNVEEQLAKWALSSHADKLVPELSEGLEKKAALARAFINNPTIVFLDEPTSSLDDKSVSALFEFLENSVCSKDNNGAVLIASHDIARVSRYCSRAIILNNGKIVRDSRIDGCSVDDVVGFYRDINR